MEFGSYKDDRVLIASSIVNHLTPGLDGTHAYVVADDLDGRRAQAIEVVGLDGTPLDAATVAALVTLAAELRGVFERCGDDDVDAAADLTNDLLARYRSAPHLLRDGDGAWGLHFHSADAGIVQQWAAGCVAGLARVIGSGEHERLGVCTADPCDRVFVDVTRNGNRRYCSPRCTNRATVAAHRRRARDA